VSFTSERLIVQVNKVNQTVNLAEIVRVDTTDSIANGVRNGAIAGAALGAWIDHLVDGRRAFYTRASLPRVSVSPILGSARRGVQLRLAW
jgi:hypothetical protein